MTKEVRYPAAAESVAELRQIVDNCPPWAVRLFRVKYQGKILDYAQADNAVREAERTERQ